MVDGLQGFRQALGGIGDVSLGHPRVGLVDAYEGAPLGACAVTGARGLVRQTRGQRGEARDVHEEDGDLLALAREGAARRQDLLGQVSGV
jgi:hypothetical protein